MYSSSCSGSERYLNLWWWHSEGREAARPSPVWPFLPACGRLRPNSEPWNQGPSGWHLEKGKGNKVEGPAEPLSWTRRLYLHTCSCLGNTVSVPLDVLCFVGFSHLGGDEAQFHSEQLKGRPSLSPWMQHNGWEDLETAQKRFSSSWGRGIRNSWLQWVLTQSG